VVSHPFGVYFPRSSAQVQPRPHDVTKLLRLVEELRERESLLKIERAAKQIDGLEVENQSLRTDGGDEGEDGRERERRK
jgi:FtsZ-binding cell division protein ZapB